jgi:hypothetical protein
MKVVMLAAGIGSRLGLAGTDHPAKVLLRFGGKSLLQSGDRGPWSPGFRKNRIQREL